ncbi:MAG: cache domain-containing protein [Desulfobacterales bacterium]|nr:cache domain-containing protein [Desulfobacterales bacterium]
MDLPLRSKLLAAFVGAVVLFGALVILSGGFLINRMVLSEAQRRTELALKTADAMLARRLEEAEKICLMMSGTHMAELIKTESPIPQSLLRDLLNLSGYDFIHILDRTGTVIATANGHAAGRALGGDTMVDHIIDARRPASGVTLVSMASLRSEAPSLMDKARVSIIPTPHAKAGGPTRLTHVMVMDAASPIFDQNGRLAGLVRVGSVLNRNFDFVDFVRENIFTVATYKGKNLGTVTIFQGDVRITTNVIGTDARRAIGTRVSEEVYDWVLDAGKTWTGPAFVVDSWYISAYKPLKNINDRVVGMLYVGVLKQRYDDMRNQALLLFVGVTFLALIGVGFLSFGLARRLSRPLARLTSATAEVSRGNLSYQLPDPPSAKRDEINRLTSAFNRMVSALGQRDKELQRSRNNLQVTADKLKKSVTHYLETLEFITHELKNQIAAMKINLLAVKDGYVGPVSEDQQAALNDVNQAIVRAEEMTLNYLNLSRIEKGELQVRIRNVHVASDVIKPVLNNLRTRLERRRMRLSLDMMPDLFVRADPSLLQIVYENLVSNAIKYGRKNGRIVLSGRKKKDRAVFSVCNDGPGVPEESMDKLFEKFFRIHHQWEEERGTGLGLFITREILRRQKGEIHAEGKYGEWISFVFTLPGPDSQSLSGCHLKPGG